MLFRSHHNRFPVTIGKLEEFAELKEKQEKWLKTMCDTAEKYGDGTCLGYGRNDYDDEPIEMCKKCNKQSSYEREGE